MPNSSLRRMLMARKSSAPSDGIVTDGLVFRLNGLNQGGVPNQWIDEIGGMVFLMAASGKMVGNGLSINGNGGAICKSPSRIFASQNSTLQVTNFRSQLNYPPNARRFYQSSKNTEVWCLGNIGDTLTAGSRGPNSKQYALKNEAPRNEIVTLNEDRCIFNGVELAGSSFRGYVGQQTEFISIGFTPGNSDAYAGIIHEIRIYDRVLTDAEIQQNYRYDIDTYFGGVIPE